MQENQIAIPNTSVGFLWPLIMNRSDNGLNKKPKLVTCMICELCCCWRRSDYV